jgi:type IV pilus assembly protein PilN
MIRINLLESERATAGKGKGAAAAGGGASGGGSALGPYVPLIAGLGLTLLGVGFFYMQMTAAIDDTNNKITAAKAEVAKLQLEKQKKEELERKRKSFQDQVNLIERLKAEQAGPVHMLDEISKALPDFVWLTSITQAGPQVKISGESSNNNSIADFLNNLQRAGDGCDLQTPEGRLKCWFPEANLDRYQDTQTAGIVSFNFTTTFRNPEVAMKDAANAAKPAPPAVRK